MDKRSLRDLFGTKLMLSITIIISVLFFIIFFTLLFRSLPIFEVTSLKELLFSTLWNPEAGSFGLAAILIGTILVTGISLLIAIPISILCAIYISEYANEKIRRILRPFLDVLAGVPSVVYGLCAFIILVPFTRDFLAPFFGVESTGLCVFTASLILAVMVFPIIISLCIEAFSAIPLGLKEASLSVGATKWETTKQVIFKAARPNIISAVLLGFGRAFGETIAVNMVVGGLPRIPGNLFDPAQTLASLIVSAYSEMMSVPLYESALMFVALLLFVVILVFNILGVVILKRSKRRYS
ncbi:MAG: phosphate ABC transporter permease subunit PstC [Candidatus Thermoplasmatota archaeon]|nr:phosphate ABC transporter permease subunit PstC [Candidatus Thermoplasmatota archaeon]